MNDLIAPLGLGLMILGACIAGPLEIYKSYNDPRGVVLVRQIGERYLATWKNDGNEVSGVGDTPDEAAWTLVKQSPNLEIEVEEEK